MSQNPFVRTCCLIGGLLALALAGVGLVLPILPTTPFLLLAGACFLRSSPRLHHWLYSHRWFGPYLMRYDQHRAMSRRHRRLTLILLWTGLSASIVLAAHTWWLRGLLVAIGVGVTAHLLSLETWEE